MITSRKDYLYYLEADRIASSIRKPTGIIQRLKKVVSPNYIQRFQRTLRKLEYYRNCKKDPFSKLYQLILTVKYNRLSVKLGFSIPVNVFGPGLSLAHYGNIVVSAGARIGANCRVHSGVGIGTEAGHSEKAPVIGNNCYLGPGAKIFGMIEIAEGIAIGANAVVNKSFLEPGIAIAGVPAKKIGEVNIFDLIIPATQIIEQGLNEGNAFAGCSALEVKERIQMQVDAHQDKNPLA